jgi:membrane-associated protease RseP (regulator of RpoE activity)
MKYPISKIFLVLGILIPTFLLSACSDKTEVVHISAKSKVWLGVHAKNIPERRLDNLKLDYGLEIIKVYKDSPAEKAGLQVDDILLKINGLPLKNVAKLSDLIKDMEVDEEIKITYIRNGKELESQATLSKSDRKIYVLGNKHKPFEHFVLNDKRAWLGVSTTKLTDQLRQFFNVPEYLGILVKEVIEDSPAEKYGLKAGDIIIRVGKKDIEDHQDLMRAIDRYDPGEEVEVKIVRDKNEKTLKVILEEGKGPISRHLSIHPENFDVYVPEMEFDFPEMHIRIPEIDVESFEELEEIEEKVREEMESHSDELNEELEKLEEELQELKKIKIHTRNRKSAVI